jgi:UrcA family protein
MTRAFTTALVTLIALGSIASAQPALNGAKQEAVSYADLDLSRDASAQIFISRIHAAADWVCGGKPDQRDMGEWGAYQACVKQAMDKAVASINEPVVAHLYGLDETSKMAAAR